MLFAHPPSLLLHYLGKLCPYGNMAILLYFLNKTPFWGKLWACLCCFPKYFLQALLYWIWIIPTLARVRNWVWLVGQIVLFPLPMQWCQVTFSPAGVFRVLTMIKALRAPCTSSLWLPPPCHLPPHSYAMFHITFSLFLFLCLPKYLELHPKPSCLLKDVCLCNANCTPSPCCAPQVLWGYPHPQITDLWQRRSERGNSLVPVEVLAQTEQLCWIQPSAHTSP